MSEPVSGRRELHWHEEITAAPDPPVPRSVCHHIREDGWVANLGQEICQDDPLITTAHFRSNSVEITGHLVDEAVMGLEEGKVELRDDQVLVIPRISDQSGPIRRRVLAPSLPRQIVRVRLSWRAGGWWVRAVQALNWTDLHFAQTAALPGRAALVDAVKVEPQSGRVP